MLKVVDASNLSNSVLRMDWLRYYNLSAGRYSVCEVLIYSKDALASFLSHFRVHGYIAYKCH